MLPLSALRMPFARAALLASLTMLCGCITSNEAMFSGAATPLRSGRYDVQYFVDGRWTSYGAGSLHLLGSEYRWAEDREAASLFEWNRNGMRFTVIDMKNNYFIVVAAAADLGSPVWLGRYVYGVARRSGTAILYDFPSCLDLLVSQRFSDSQIAKLETRECLYSNRDSLTAALIAYAKRTTMRRRLAPFGR